MKKIALSLLIVLLLAPGGVRPALAGPQETSWIEGRIFDKDTKDPLPAYVLAEDGRGVSADGQGRFRLAVAGKAPASVKLSVFLIGYKRKDVTARIGEALAVALELEPLAVKEIAVTADSVMTDAKSARTITLGKMDVYTLPGTAADPLNASQVLPGVNALPDTSSLLIRGGAPDEVAYFLDGIEISHPFQSESLNESYFSIFDNQIIQGFSIATSGFSPRYGDALSGVMDLTVKDSLPKSEGGIGLSVLGLSSYAGFPIQNWGNFVGSYNRGFSDLLTALNGRQGSRFRTENGFGKFNVRLGGAHQIRIYGLADAYHFDQTGSFGVGTNHGLAAMTWTAAWSPRFATKVTAAGTRYDVDFTQTGVLAVRSRDDALQSRVDALWDLDRHYLEFGVDVLGRRLDTTVEAGAPYFSQVRAARWGFYANDKFRLTDRIYVNAGGRVSALDILDRPWTFDPRFSLVWLPSKRDAVRFSTGLYHQFGGLLTLAQTPALRPKSALHFALSYDRILDDFEFRATVYDKEYRGLFLETATGGPVTNGGSGYARGAEAFLKLKRKAFEVLLVYNALQSRRKEGDVAVLAPSPYEIAHSATGIVRWIFKGGSVGIRYSFATGRSYTPLEGMAPDGGGAEGAAASPVWGAPFSARYPAYRRMDLNGMANIRLFGRMAVLYFGVTNVLDDVNILRYDYAPDSGSRADQQSIFGRTLFAGLYLPFF